MQCQHRWQKVLNPDLVKGPWTKEVPDNFSQLMPFFSCGFFSPKGFLVLGSILCDKFVSRVRFFQSFLSAGSMFYKDSSEIDTVYKYKPSN